MPDTHEQLQFVLSSINTTCEMLAAHGGEEDMVTHLQGVLCVVATFCTPLHDSKVNLSAQAEPIEKLVPLTARLLANIDRWNEDRTQDRRVYLQRALEAARTMKDIATTVYDDVCTSVERSIEFLQKKHRCLPVTSAGRI